MTRLIVVSNRVALPRDRSARAGGLAVGVLSALKRSGGMWFGWSGEATDQPAPQPKVIKSGGITYATIDFTAEEFNVLKTSMVPSNVLRSPNLIFFEMRLSHSLIHG